MQRHAVARLIRVTIGAFPVLGMLSTSALAQSSPASTPVERGKARYRQSCSVCHGERGDGKAQAVSALNPRPADLTSLTRRYGSFPAARVEETLKASASGSEHKTNGGMLVWGAIFLADANGDRQAADERVHDLVAFLESIQRK